MPDSPAEQAIAAYFHLQRSASKRKPDPGVERILEAVKKRAEAVRNGRT